MLTPALLMPVRLATFTIIESHNTHQRRTITSRIFPVASLTGASRFLFWRMGVVSFAIFISLACGFPTSSGWLVAVADWKLAVGITSVWFATVRARIGFSGFNKISTNTWKLTVDQSIISCTLLFYGVTHLSTVWKAKYRSHINQYAHRFWFSTYFFHTLIKQRPPNLAIPA